MQSTVVKILEAIKAPLGFFVLALLIVEGFFAFAFSRGGLDGDGRLTVVYLGAGMFVMVVAVVAMLVWNKPENLTFDQQAHLDRSRAEYGTDSKTVVNRDALLPTVADRASGP